MYERSYGYLYQELGEHPTAAEIAKAIRADIKQAQQEGLLPASWSYSVRSETFAGGQSIDVEVRDCADAWQECDGTVPGSRREFPGGGWTASPCSICDGSEPHHRTLTEEASVAKMTLERIHNAYNHDGSETQVDYFDVRYYGTVQFEDARAADFRKREAERLAARKAEREAGEIVGKVTNYKRDGSHVTHLVVEIPTPNGAKPTRRALACGARSWSGSTMWKSPNDAEVTCSRCAKRAAATREP